MIYHNLRFLPLFLVFVILIVPGTSGACVQPAVLYSDLLKESSGYSLQVPDKSPRFPAIIRPPERPVLPDTVHLEEIRVEATRLFLPDRLHPVRIYRSDSTVISRYAGAPLSDFMENELPVMIRNYGPAGISSISVRGFGPGQTQILWEGIPVNHPMVGQTDLALYPSSVFSSIEFVPGNSAAAYGSGSIAGTVHLSSGNSGREASVSRTYGDFGMSRTGIGLTEISGPLTFSMSASGYTSENDYSYFDRLRQRNAKRANADREAFSLNAKTEYDAGRWNVGSAFWSGYNRGGIPGSAVAGRSSARQHDNWIRWAATAGYRRGTTRFNTHAYYSRHNLDYLDERTRTDSRSGSSAGGITAGVTNYLTTGITVNSVLQAGRQWINSSNYDQIQNRTYGGLSVTGVIELPAGFRLFPGIRADTFSDIGWAVSPSAGINLELFNRHLVLRGQYSNDFKAPAMNDLFWTPGGNPDLHPERGVTLETGASFEWINRDLMQFVLDATIYRTRFRDGIVWAPVSGSIWSPSNVQGLKSEGIELTQEFMLRFYGMRLKVINMWQKTEISSVTSRFSGDPVTGRQRPYIPDQALKTSLSLHHRNFTLFANRIYTGERFTTTDHSSPLDPLESYTVVNAGVSLTLNWRGFYTTTGVILRNLAKRQYEVIAWYPMPARNREISISIGYRGSR
jgi:vitamin B12 transporter